MPGKQGMPCPVPPIRQLGKPVVGREVESQVLYHIAGRERAPDDGDKLDLPGRLARALYVSDAARPPWILCMRNSVISMSAALSPLCCKGSLHNLSKAQRLCRLLYQRDQSWSRHTTMA